MSDATASTIDSEIRSIVDGAYDDATKILKKNADQLELLAQALLEYETLSGDEITTLIEGGTIVRNADDTPEAPRTKSRTGIPGGVRKPSAETSTDTPDANA